MTMAARGTPPGSLTPRPRTLPPRRAPAPALEDLDKVLADIRRTCDGLACAIDDSGTVVLDLDDEDTAVQHVDEVTESMRRSARR